MKVTKIDVIAGKSIDKYDGRPAFESDKPDVFEVDTEEVPPEGKPRRKT